MFGIIRVRNLHAGDINSTEKHNFRLYENQPNHLIKLNKREDVFQLSNFHHISLNGEIQDRAKGLNGDIKNAIKSRFLVKNIKPRKNSVVALEYVLAISPNASKDIGEVYCYDSVLKRLDDFIMKKHGKENIIAKSYHFDESNPHVHVIVTPILEKKISWKNSKGEGFKIENRLSARDFTGNKQKLRDLQTDFHNHCLTTPFSKLTEHRFERGMDNRERKKLKLRTYEDKTNLELGRVREELKVLKSSLKHVKKEFELEELNRLLIIREDEIEKIAKAHQIQKERDAKKSFDKTSQDMLKKESKTRIIKRKSRGI